MAVYNSILTDRVWITVDEVKEWLEIRDDKIDVPAAAIQASKNIQDIKYTAKTEGIGGNSISIEYTGGAVAGSEVVTVVGNAITVQIEDGVSTAEQIRSAVALNGPASALVFVELVVIDPDTLSDVQNRTQVIQVLTNLENGADDVPFEKTDIEPRRRRIERLMNIACDKIESIIQSNVLAKTYQEDIDGNDSNVIVPSKWPVLTINEVKIDYNRNFGPESIVDSLNYLLRGVADVRSNVSIPDIRIVGNDIYLRDDDNDNVIGRIFSGSVAGSVRINYDAGWARDIEDCPWDLRQAAVLLVEFYEYKRASRDLGVQSKGVRGESYTKIRDGIPEAIHELIAPYISHSFGSFERIQNNIMGV